MALVQCGECSRDVSTNAKACPNCGSPLRRRSWLVWVGAGIVLAAACAGGTVILASAGVFGVLVLADEVADSENQMAVVAGPAVLPPEPDYGAMRSEMVSNVWGIQTAEYGYEAAFDTFVSAPDPWPRAIAELDSQQEYWGGGSDGFRIPDDGLGTRWARQSLLLGGREGRW